MNAAIARVSLAVLNDFTDTNAGNALLDIMRDHDFTEEEAEAHWFATVKAAVTARIMSIATAIIRAPRDDLDAAVSWAVREAVTPGHFSLAIDIVPGMSGPAIVSGQPSSELELRLYQQSQDIAWLVHGGPRPRHRNAVRRIRIGATRLLRWRARLGPHRDDAA